MRENGMDGVTELWEDYRRGLDYQAQIGLSKNLPIFVNFYEGKQWPAETKRTRGLPRPVINLIKMICRNKKSAILSAPFRIVYRAADQEVNVDRFNHFASYIGKEMGLEELDKKAIHDAVRKGPYFYHFYWDAEARGKDATRDGGLRGEVIDPLRIFFANPTERDEQKQEWILIVSRENIETVKAKADRDVDRDTIVADEDHDKYGTVEQEGDKLCTVLTRYFRKNGNVWYERGTKNAVVNQARPLAPDIKAAMKDLGIDDGDGMDAPNNSQADGERDELLIPEAVKAPLYPIVAGSYEPRENCIYGLGEVEGLIPNQKLINFMLGMMALAVQEQAWGKYVVMPNALAGQSISNEPGQVLVDHSGTGNGIKRMTDQPIQNMPLELVETISNLTRVVTGSSEVMTGETLGASMSGAAIAQLQAQAKQPNEELRDAFRLVKQRQGRIFAQFLKLYYADAEYVYEEQSEDGTTTTVRSDVFNSSEYENVDFEVVAEATVGTHASPAGDINMLETLLARNAISVKTFLRAYPEDALSNRSAILSGIAEDEKSQIAQLGAQIQQYEQQLMQYAEIFKRQQQSIDGVQAVIRENGQLKEMLARLYSEASQKIALANEEIARGNQAIGETTADATEFAEALAGQMRMNVSGDARDDITHGRAKKSEEA